MLYTIINVTHEGIYDDIACACRAIGGKIVKFVGRSVTVEVKSPKAFRKALREHYKLDKS